MGKSICSRGLVLMSLLALGMLFLPARSAEAWETYGWGRGRACGCGPRVVRSGWGHRATYASTYARRACRAGYLNDLNTARFMAHGSGWQLLRRYLYRIQIQPAHTHPRSYFYRRWPSRLGRATEVDVWGGHRCIGGDHPWNECAVSSYALGTDLITPVPVTELAPMERLERGMERFFRGAYVEAKRDFESAVTVLADDPRPHVGLLMCSTMEKDWKEVARRLRGLHEKGWLDGQDRLDLEASFADPKLFAKVREGLVSRVKWDFHETELQVVAGWAFVQTGDLEAARGHFRAARRFAPRHPIAKHLLATMEGAPEAETTPPEEQADLPELPLLPSLTQLEE